MVVTIKDVLGPKWFQYKLYDNNSLSTGGLSHEEETLGEFLADTDIDQYDSIGLLQDELKSCGIMQIEEADRYVQEIIEQKIWDIEEELGINICDWKWDYKEING